MSYYQEQFLYWVMCDGYSPGLGWNLVCDFRVDTFFKRYVRKECLIGDSALAVAAMKSALCAQNSWSLWSAANTYFDVSCLGVKIYEQGLYNTDTTMLPALMGTRYSRLARTEAYLYGSSRLGLDTEEQVIADSLDKVRCVYNPLIKLWHKTGIADTSKQIFTVVNDSLIQYHTSGLKRYEFSNHLGNVLAVTSDRKIAVDTLSGLKVDFYYADLYAVQDYDPFGMIQVGRSWKRKDYRFSFNGKEDESWQVQDYGFRHYDPLIARFISVDPLTAKYPELTPFQFASNRPIDGVDWDGLEFRRFSEETVRKSAERLAESPEKIYQGRTGLCGIAACVYMLGATNPHALTCGVLSLWAKGEAQINNHRIFVSCIAPISRMDPNSFAFPYREKNKLDFAADWILMASIKHSENFLGYNGTSCDLSSLTTPSEVKKLMKDMVGLEDIREHNISLVTSGVAWSVDATLAELQSNHDSGKLQALLVNTNMLNNPNNGSLMPDHWVVYGGNLKLNTNDQNETISFTFDVISWGEKTSRTYTAEQFKKNYYGAISGAPKTEVNSNSK